MAEVNPTISVRIDTSDSLRQIRSLQTQLSAFNDSVLRSSAQAVAAQKQFNSALNASVLGTKAFTTSIVKTSTEVDKFSEKLEKHKLSFNEYFRYGASQVGLFRRAFTNEFDTIERVATERVKRLQTQYVSLGKDANGVARSMAIIPNSLDMSNANTQLQLAAQRTQIFNKLLSDGSTQLLNFGKNTQWAGRQLMVGFSIPLAMFGTIASKTFMDLETQATKFKRVYGDLFTTTEETNRNLEAVKSLGLEYTKYGIVLSDSLDIAAKAAAAGMQNEKLMAGTEQTLRLATLGQIDYNQSLEATIALQSAFAITAENLGTEIDFLNAVENQTVLSLDDVTKAIPRAATVVNGLGGNVRDLAAFMAAMKEGGVSAEQGANAIKSGLGSLINPTNAANEKLMNLGINIEKITRTNSGNLLATVQEFGKALDGLSSFERQQALETLFGKYQYARLGVLFQNINREGSQASTVLKLAGENATDLAKLSEKELSIISESTTVKFQAMIEKLKVAIAPIGEEFLKIITPIGEVVTKIANWFNDLPNGVKNAITIITTVVAGIGPIALMTFGLIANGIANIVKGIVFARNMFMKFGSVITGNAKNTEYLSMAELDAAAASASLEGRVDTLTSSLLLQKDAVSDLITLYSRLAKQAQVTAAQMPQGFGPPMMGPLTTMRRMATGGWVGGTGNKDSEPALLAPGEFVVNAKAAAQYGPILGAMNAGTIKGYVNGTETKSVSVAGETVDLSSLRGSSKSLDSLIRALSRIEASGLDATEVLNGLRSIISNLSGNQGIPHVGRQLREMFPELKELTGLERAHVTAQQDATREALKTLAASEEITGSTRNTLQILDRINDVLSDAGLLKVETGTGSGARAAKRSNLVFNMEEGINKALSRGTGVSGSKLFQSLDKTGMKLYDTILQQAKAANMSEQELAQLASQSGILHNELLKLIDTTYREYTIKDKVTDEEIKTGAKVKAFGDIVKEAFIKVETETSDLKTFMDQLDTEFSTLRHTVSLTADQIAKLTELGYVIKTNQSGTSYDITTPEGQNITGVSRASSKTLSTGIAKETDFTKFGITQGEAIADGMLLGAGDIVKEMITRYRRSPHPAVVAAARQDAMAYLAAFQQAGAGGIQPSLFAEQPPVVPVQGVFPGMEDPNQFKQSSQDLDDSITRTTDVLDDLGDELTPAQQATRRLTEETDRTSTQSKTNRGFMRGFGGKLFGLTMAIDAVAIGITALGVDIGPAGQAALGGLNAIAMIGPFLPQLIGMLANPVGLVIAAILAAAAGIWGIVKLSNNVVDRSKELSRAMFGASESISEMAKYFGKKTYSEQLTELEVSRSTGKKQSEKVLTEAQQFLESDPGKKLISDINQVKDTLGSKKAGDALANQLLRSILSGAIGPKMAVAIATEMGTVLQSKDIAVSVAGTISSMVGMDGQKLENNRMRIFADILADATDLKRAMADAGVQWDGESWYGQVSMILTGRGTADLTAAGLSESIVQGQGLIKEELDRNRLAFEQNKITAEEFLETNEKILINAKEQGLTWEGVRDKFRAAYPDEQDQTDAIAQPIIDGMLTAIQAVGGDNFRTEFLGSLETADLSGTLQSALSVPGESIQQTINRLYELGVEAGAAGTALSNLGSINLLDPKQIREGILDVQNLIQTYENLSQEERNRQGLDDTYYSGLKNTLKTLQTYETGGMRLAIAVQSNQLSPEALQTLMTDKGLTSRQLAFQIGTMTDKNSAAIFELINQSGGKGAAIDIAFKMLAEEDDAGLTSLLLETTRGNKNQINIDLVLETLGLSGLKKANDLMDEFNELPEENRKKAITEFIDQNFSTFYGNLDWFLQQDDMTQKTFMANYIIAYDEQGNLSAAGQALLSAAMASDPTLARNIGEGRIDPRKALASVLQKPFVSPTTTKPEKKPEDTGKSGSGSEKEKPKTGRELFNERLDQLRKESGQLEKISYLQRQVGNYSSKMFEGLDPKAIKYLMKHQEELQKLIVAYRRLQESKLVDHFQELGVKMNETYRIQSLMPMASAEMVSELMDLVDTTALTSDQIVKYGNKLLEVKRAQEAMKTSAQKLSEELSGLADVARSQIEQINRLEINPLERQIQAIEDAIASIQSAIAGLEASKAPLQSQIDALRKEEEELQKVYDERIKALESIKRANDAILAQQRGQLSIADALSRGDIAAAAAAQQDLQQTLDQQNAEEMRRAVEEDYNNQKEQIQNRIAAVEAQIAAIDAQIAAKQAEIAAKQAEIAKAKEKQLALEEKIYKMQLLQSMIDTTKKIADAQRLGDTAGVQIGQSLLASQLAISGSPTEFFKGLGLTPDALQTVLNQIFTAGINPEQLVNMVGKETADAILKGINTANLGTVAEQSIKGQLEKGNIGPTVAETATKLSGIADKTKTAIDGVITQFNEGKIGLKTALLTIVGQMASALTEGLLVKTDTTAFSQALKEIGTSVQETVKSFSQKIGNAIIGLTTTLTNFNLQMNEKISAIAGAIGQIASGISSGTAGGIASVSAAMSSIGGSFGLMASNLSASVGSATSTINSAVGVLNGAAGALNGAAGAIYGAIGALAAAAASIPRGFSSGGLVPGLGNTDSVPAMLTPGEYVITKDVVNALGTDFLDKLNTGSMPTYAITSKSNGISAYSGQSSDSGSVYNYSVNVSAQSNANAGDIANIVMRKIKMTNKRTIKGNNY